jgi:hypothetical protein
MVDRERQGVHRKFEGNECLFSGADLVVDPEDYIGRTRDETLVFVIRSDRGTVIRDILQCGRSISAVTNESQSPQLIVMGEPAIGSKRDYILSINRKGKSEQFLVDGKAFRKAERNAQLAVMDI